MAFLLKAAKEFLRISSKSQSSLPNSAKEFARISSKSQLPLSNSATRLEQVSPFFSRTLWYPSKKPHADFFAWVTSSTHAYCKYAIPLARRYWELNPPPQTRFSFELRAFMLRALEIYNYSEEDLRKLLMFCLAGSPELAKVTDNEIIRKMALQIPYAEMMRTIADECIVQYNYRLSRFRVGKGPGRLLYMFVNVPDFEQQTLKVFVCANHVVVIGKHITRSNYDQELTEFESRVLAVLYQKFRLELATGEIIDTSRMPPAIYDFKQATFEFLREELRISYPLLPEEVKGLEEAENLTCLQVKPKQFHD